MLSNTVSANVSQVLTINGKIIDKVVTKITFEDDNAVLYFGNERNIYDLNDIKITFSYSEGIENIETMKIYKANNNIIISGTIDGLEVSIFDISGKCLHKENTNNGITELNISDLKNGIYIISIDNKRIKLKK